MAKRKILTFDYGATSGRAILGEYENGKLTVTACLGQKMLVLVFSR